MPQTHHVEANVWAPVATATVGLAAGVLQQRRYRPLGRDEIKADLELWGALPVDSPVRAVLMADIEQRVRELVSQERSRRRDPSGIAIGLVLLGVFGWLSWYVWQAGGAVRWFDVPVFALAAIGLFGFLESLRRVERDPRGIAVKKKEGLKQDAAA